MVRPPGFFLGGHLAVDAPQRFFLAQPPVKQPLKLRFPRRAGAPDFVAALVSPRFKQQRHIQHQGRLVLVQRDLPVDLPKDQGMGDGV